MNSLTVNLHLLMVSFYRPTAERHRIVIEDAPSRPTATRCAARPASTASTRRRGGAPPAARRRGHPAHRGRRRPARRGRRSSRCVLLGGVNYLTGELLDIPTITAAGRAGRRRRRLGPRARGRQRAAAVCTTGTSTSPRGARTSTSTPGRGRWPACSCTSATSVATTCRASRAGGAPTRRPASRWRPTSRPPATADAWQLSNPPIFSMGPVRTSLELFDQVGMAALRARSVRLTGVPGDAARRGRRRRTLRLITPRDPERRGAQLSCGRAVDDAGELAQAAARRARRDRRRARAGHRAPRAGAAVLDVPRLLARGSAH